MMYNRKFFYLSLMTSLLIFAWSDVSTSDPYVVVEDGRTRWHKTGVVANTLNPVWTISTGSLFLIQTNLTDFFEKAMRMEFIVKDYDTVGSNEILGSVLVNKNEMFSGDGERIDYELETAKYAANSDIVVGKKKVRSLSFATVFRQMILIRQI